MIAVIEVFRREGRSFLMPPVDAADRCATFSLNRESLDRHLARESDTQLGATKDLGR